MISSPCLNICTMDPASDQCYGCGRTRDEIAMWGSISEAERLKIMESLPQRVAELERALLKSTTPANKEPSS